MRILRLSGDENVLLDDSSFLWAAQFSWHAEGRPGRRYAYGNRGNPNNARGALHREVILCQDAQVVHHVNGNGLDDRSSNLRACSDAQNLQGFRRKSLNKSSVYRGVSRCDARKGWLAQIQVGKDNIRLGLFPEEKQAAASYDEAALKYFGKFAQLNLGHPKRLLMYLACPYSHPDLEERTRRFLWANIAAAELSKAQATVFSPITHSHSLAMISKLPTTWHFWKRIDTQFLSHAYALVVLTLPGWEESVGVSEEIKIAKESGIQIEYLDPDNLRFSPSVKKYHL